MFMFALARKNSIFLWPQGLTRAGKKQQTLHYCHRVIKVQNFQFCWYEALFFNSRPLSPHPTTYTLWLLLIHCLMHTQKNYCRADKTGQVNEFVVYNSRFPQKKEEALGLKSKRFSQADTLPRAPSDQSVQLAVHYLQKELTKKMRQWDSLPWKRQKLDNLWLPEYMSVKNVLSSLCFTTL